MLMLMLIIVGVPATVSCLASLSSAVWRMLESFFWQGSSGTSRELWYQSLWLVCSAASPASPCFWNPLRRWSRAPYSTEKVQSVLQWGGCQSHPWQKCHLQPWHTHTHTSQLRPSHRWETVRKNTAQTTSCTTLSPSISLHHPPSSSFGWQPLSSNCFYSCALPIFSVV